MTMTVEKLIEELQKIEDKQLGIEIYVQYGQQGRCDIGSIGMPAKGRNKVMIFARQKVVKIPPIPTDY